MEIIVGNWRIAPYQGNTCWQLQRRKSKRGEGKSEWDKPRKYPSNLAHAFSLIREQERLENPSTSSMDVDSVISELRKMDEEFIENVKEVLSEQGG